MVNSKPYYPEITCLKGIAILFGKQSKIGS